MHYNTQDAFLRAGFDLVRQYDPETYERMTRDKWLVSTDFDEIFGLARDVNSGQRLSDDFGAWFTVQAAYGATVSDANPTVVAPEPLVYINRDSIERWASKAGVNPAAVTASTLVHEYEHTHESDMDETAAFRAGSAFAAKLPGRDGVEIKRMSDTVMASLRNGQYAWRDV